MAQTNKRRNAASRLASKESPQFPTPRILALVASRVLYGQERANLLVLEALKSQGCEILAIVEDCPFFQGMPRELERRGFAYIAAPMIGRRAEGFLLDFLIGNPTRFLRARRLLKRVLVEFRPTHVHVPNPYAFLIANAMAPPGLPIIYRIGDRPATHNAIWRWVWRRIATRVNHFVADSEFIAGLVQELGVDRGRISVIYPRPAPREQPPRPEVVHADFQHVLYMGQIAVNKGPDRLLEAFRRIASEYPKARLTFLGRISDSSDDGWARGLREIALSDPVIRERVRFRGETNNIYEHLAEAAFLVMPSVCDEAFGLVVGEAKAAARPSVVFPSGGLVEQIAHGEDGFICRDTSVESLVEGLRYYLDSPERVQSHGRAAFQSLTRLRAESFDKLWHAVYRVER
jgi:glycosyltransferase involved in cell wall biosynthesis